MNAENFAEWLRLQGHQVIRTESSYWFDAGPRSFQAFPFHWLIAPTEEELNRLMWKHSIIALRYSTPVESSSGYVSYHAVYDLPEYTLEMLDRKTRQNVRKGIKNCKVEQISFQRLADEGWELEKDTMIRQGRDGQRTEKEWRDLCMAADKVPGFAAWGAIVGGQLGASLLTFHSDDCLEMIYQHCRRDLMPYRVNNALTFTVTQQMAADETSRSIFYTLQSLDAPASIDEYKFRMNFVPKLVRQRVVFHPLLRLFVNKASYGLVKRMLSDSPDRPLLAKAEGMFRFHLQGKLPLTDQDWSEHIEHLKHSMLNGSGPAVEAG